MAIVCVLFECHLDIHSSAMYHPLYETQQRSCSRLGSAAHFVDSRRGGELRLCAHSAHARIVRRRHRVDRRHALSRAAPVGGAGLCAGALGGSGDRSQAQILCSDSRGPQGAARPEGAMAGGANDSGQTLGAATWLTSNDGSPTGDPSCPPALAIKILSPSWKSTFAMPFRTRCAVACLKSRRWRPPWPSWVVPRPWHASSPSNRVEFPGCPPG